MRREANATGPGRKGRDLLRLGFLIGGGGRTLINIADRIDAGVLPAAIELVIALREDLPGVARARERGLEVCIIDPATAGSTEATDIEINRRFAEHRIDLICMAGYLRLFRVAEAFRDRVMNIHPALLPSFGGTGMYRLLVHRAVLERGCKVSGCTVHFVDEQYDHGPIIVQKTCAVHEDDDAESLAARVFALECEAYPEAIALIAAGRVTFDGPRVRLAPPAVTDSVTGNG